MNKRRGRPSGPSDTRERILRAARRQFADVGYAETSLRAIAREADVDHALVSYYFGSKEGLFRAVAEVVLSPREVLDSVAGAVPLEQLGGRLLTAIIRYWEEPTYRGDLTRLMAAAVGAPEGHPPFREYLEAEIVARLAVLLEPTHGPARARRCATAAATVIAGLFFTRYLLRLESVASLSPREVTRIYGPLMQAALRLP